MKQFHIKLFLLLFLDISTMYSMHKKEMTIFSLYKILKTFKNFYIYKNPDKKLTKIILNPPQNWKPEIEECLKNGANINCTTLTTLSREKGTPLFYAAEHSNEKLVSYLLDHNADVNACTLFGATPLHAIISRLWDNPSKFDIKIVKKLLHHRANPNAELLTGHTILSWAAKKGSDELIKMLIEYGANVNQKNAFLSYNPLWSAITNLQSAKELCNAGISLISIDSMTRSTAFHVAIEKKVSQEHVEMLMTHLQSDVYNQKKDMQLKKTILEILWVFQKLNNLENFPNIPEELQWYILSYLALDSCSEFNKKFCKEIVKKGHKNHLIKQILHKRIEYLEQILQTPNRKGDTALQLLQKYYQKDNLYRQNIEPLLTRDQLYLDINEFNKNLANISSLPKNNLIGKMHENISETILGNFSHNNH